MATTRKSAAKRGSAGNAGKRARGTAAGSKRGQRGKSGGAAARQQAGAVILFALGLFTVCLALIQGDKLWLTLHNTLFAFFGAGAVFMGVILLYIAVLQAMGRPWQARAILCGLTLLAFCGALQIFQMGLPSAEHVLDQLVECVQQGIGGRSGGAFGIFLGLPLLHLFGKLGAGIIIVLLVLVLVLLLSGATLVSVYRAARKPVRAVRAAYAEEMRYREQAAAQKQQKPKEPIILPMKTREEKSSGSDVKAEGSKIASSGAQPQETQVRVARKGQTIDVPLDGEVVKGTPIPEPTQESPVVKAGGVVTNIATQTPPSRIQAPVIDIAMDDQFSPALAGGFSLGSAAVPTVQGPCAQEGSGAAEPDQESADPDLDALVRKALAQGDSDDLFTVPEENAAESPAQIESALKLPPLLGDDGDIQDVMAKDPFFRDRKETTPPTSVHLEKIRHALTEDANDAQEQTRRFSEQEPLTSLALEEEPVPEVEIQRPVRPYRKPPLTLLNPVPPKSDVDTEEMKANAQLLVDTLASFGVQTRIVDIARGPAVTRYELQPSAGVKISRITALADDIALNLAASGVRIEAPIPNKAAVGIEVPNKTVSPVHFREIVESPGFQEAKSRLTVSLGRDIAGQIVVGDIASMPHVLIAGSTGSGKSVCINSIIMSLLYQATPEEVRFLMVDPKVVELGVYNGIPHLLVPVVTDPKKAAGALSWAVKEMLERYKCFADTGVRDLKSYNTMAAQKEDMETKPQIVIIIDELADLMMAAPNEIEDYICRLAQMARAAGMHLIIATQRPSVDVITGVIKANIPSRIAFAVSSAVDSRTILDTGGAEKLLGKGDMLFNPIGTAKPRRVQGCFVTDEEIERVISFIKEDFTADYNESIVQQIDSHVIASKGNKGTAKDTGDDEGEDEMLMSAIECVVEAGSASTSFLQRRLKVGYARAGRIMDQMEAMGIVGPYDGAKPRQVLIGPAQLMEMKHSRGL